MAGYITVPVLSTGHTGDTDMHDYERYDYEDEPTCRDTVWYDIGTAAIYALICTGATLVLPVFHGGML
jgi:hypothetical protein